MSDVVSHYFDDKPTLNVLRLFQSGGSCTSVGGVGGFYMSVSRSLVSHNPSMAVACYRQRLFIDIIYY